MSAARLRRGGAAAILLALAVQAQAVLAETRVDKLVRVLRVDDVVEVLRQEGIAFGADLDDEMLNGEGGDWFAERVASLYDPGRMTDGVRMAIANTMTPDQIDESIAFFASDRGRRILSLEVSARQAMLDDDIESAAREAYRAMDDTADPKMQTITRLIEANDLIELNVRGTLRASYFFRRGLVDGGASQMSEDQITGDVWAERDETREDTRTWLYAYMLFAYGPLSIADLEAYVDYSRTDAGQALNTALFDGFDTSYDDISHSLGVMIAQAVSASDL